MSIFTYRYVGSFLINLILFVLLSAHLTFSQRLVVQTYTQEDGLPSSTIHSFIQGQYGRIWMGTRNGVAVYDGLDWIYYNIADGLPENEVFCLKRDEVGRVWASCSRNSINISFFDGEKWNRFNNPSTGLKRNLSARSFEVIGSASKTQILVTTRNSGLFYFQDSGWKNITSKDGLPSDNCSNVISHQNKFYVATNSGIVIIQNGLIDLSLNEIIPKQYKEVLALAFDRNKKDNRLWVLSNNCLAYIQNNRFNIVSTNFQVKDHLTGECVQFIPDYYGLSIFGNRYGMKFLDKSTNHVFSFNEQSGIRVLMPYAIFLDREWNLWLGGRVGITKIRSMRFVTYRQTAGLLKDEVSAITELRKGEMIFGHIAGLSILYKNIIKNIQFNTIDSLYEIDKVLDLCTDKSKNVWFAAERFGIGKLDLGNNIRWFKFPKGDDYANSILQDFKGKIYAQSNTGIYLLNNEKFGRINLPAYLGRARFRKLFLSPDNKICIATYNSGVIIRENENNYRIIKSYSNPKANDVYAVCFSSRDGILVGAQDGLFKVVSDSLVKFDNEMFKNENPVYFITEDADSNYWIGTDKGVIKLGTKEIREYSIRSGLAGLETNRDAGYIDSNGRIWIGTDRGVSQYFKEFDYRPKIPPSIYIESIEPRIGLFHASENITIDAGSASIVFKVKVISLIDENQNRFEYKLEGIDKEWNFSSSRNPLIRYTNLSPGKYRLIIRGQNADGIKGLLYTIDNINIPLPFYKAWWFYVLGFIVFSFLVLSFVTYRMNLRYSRKLQLEVTKRTELLNESERRYRQMFEKNQAIMLLIDADTLDIIDVNDSAEKFYGNSENRLINMNYSDISKNVTSESISETIHYCINNEQLLLSKHVLQNGTEKFVEVSFSEIDVRGRKLFYAIINDVTERIITEAALKESEEKYRTLIESMIDGVFVIQDGKMIFVNNALAGFLGYKPAEMINESFQKFIAPEDLKMVVERNKARLAGENVINEYEFNMLHKDGKTRINVLIHVSVFTFKGRIASMGTIKNITESRIQELKIKQFYTAIEQAPVGVIITDKNNKIEYVNPTFCQISGYDFEEVIGKEPFILAGKDSFETTDGISDEIKKGKIWSGEVLNKRKDGTKYWVMATVSPIRNLEGDITHFISVEQDITFEKYAREEIRRNEKLLTSIVNHAPVIIAAFDKRGYITFIRGKELETRGIKNDEFVGVSIFEYYKEDENLLQDIKRSINGEVFSTTRAFDNLVYEINYTPILNEGEEIVGSIAVASNITERYNAEQKLIAAKEEAERSDRLKSDFLAQMSHEIRTPVNTILSFTSLLEEEVKNKIPEELKEVFSFIDGGGRRLIRTIDMILNMSQFQAGTYKPMMQNVDLDKDILDKIVAELRPSARHKNLTLNYFVKTDSTFVNGDNYTIGQIFINLIDNAIKYTHEGKIEVSIIKIGKLIAVEIEDTGIGISKKYLPHLFDAFSQEETGYTRRFDGTGLGLALVKRYIEINNAEIKVVSVKTSGTKFSILFNQSKTKM